MLFLCYVPVIQCSSRAIQVKPEMYTDSFGRTFLLEYFRPGDGSGTAIKLQEDKYNRWSEMNQRRKKAKFSISTLSRKIPKNKHMERYCLGDGS